MAGAVLVLSVKRYDFKDDAGRQVTGAKVVYTDGDVENQADRRGLVTFEGSADIGCFQDFVNLPAWYELQEVRRPGPRGSVKYVIVGGRFIAAAQIGVPAEAVMGPEDPAAELISAGGNRK